MFHGFFRAKLSGLVLLMLGIFIMGGPAQAIPVILDYVDPNPGTFFKLLVDTDENGYANINDQIGVSVIITDTLGGCDRTWATVDISAYGGYSDQALTCEDTAPNTMRYHGEFTIIDAGAFGIDVGPNSGSSVQVTVHDEGAGVLLAWWSNNLGDLVVDTTAVNGVDTIAPHFVNAPDFWPVHGLVQATGAAPDSGNNYWYYYPGQNYRFSVATDDTLDTEIADVHVCVQSYNQNVTNEICDFATETLALDVDYIAGTGSTGGVWAFNQSFASFGTTANQMSSYPSNILLIDNAGNRTPSVLASEMMMGIWDVNPINFVPEIDYPSTTDWELDIVDYSAVTSLTFEAAQGMLVLDGVVNSIDLTNLDTLTGIMALGENLLVSGGDSSGDPAMGLNSDALSQFNIPATVYVTAPSDSGDQPGIVVYDENRTTILGYVPINATGGESAGGDTFDNFVWDGTDQLVFTTTGFSFFGFDATPPTVVSTNPSNGGSTVSLSQAITLTFDEPVDVGTCNVSDNFDTGGLVINPGASSSQISIAHPVFTLSSVYTYSVSCADMVGNSMPTSKVFTFTARIGGATRTTPAIQSFTINNNAASTNTAAVTLNMNVTDAAQMLLSNEASFAGATWETYSATKAWTLPAGLGTKTVHAMFMSATNDMSNATSDAIEVVAAGTQPTVPTGPTEPTQPTEPVVTNPPTYPTVPNQLVGTQPAGNSGETWVTGSWIKLATSPAVYYLDSAMVRHAYPTQDVYASYFGLDFSRVKTITTAEMATYNLGRNVPFAVGSLIKISSVPKVYRVEGDAKLRWITTEALAVTMYGPSWGAYVKELPVGFFGDYTIGLPLE